MELWTPPESKTGITIPENGFLDALYYYQAQIDMIDDGDKKQMLYFAAANTLNTSLPRGAKIDIQSSRATLYLPGQEDAYVDIPDVGVAGTFDDLHMTIPQSYSREYTAEERALHYQLSLAVDVENIYALAENTKTDQERRDEITAKGRIPIVAAKAIMLDMDA